MSRQKGYTLLETLLAVTVTMIVMAAAMRLLSYSAAMTARAVVRGELTENARTAADVMSANIRRASEIKIIADGNNNILKRIEMPNPDSKDRNFVFAYYPNALTGDGEYHKLYFTGADINSSAVNKSNELASNLAYIRVIHDNANTLVIEILTDNTVTANASSIDYETANKRENVTVEPVFIRVPIDITGKKINQ